MRAPWFACLVVVGLASVTDPAAAQNDRRNRRDPELVLETGGRTGTCDALLFTSDGQHLLAVGDDKVVRVWRCADGKLEPAQMPVLRWPTWREQRGAIYALALSPDKDGNPDEGSRVAIGGYGASNSSTVAVIDRTTGKILHTITPEPKPGQSLYAVMAIGFAPSGDRVAFGTGDGSVFLWDLKKGTCRHLGRQEPVTGKFNRIRCVRFLKQDQLLTVAETGEVARWDVAEGKAVKKVLFTVKDEKFVSLGMATLSPDGLWLAAATKGPVVALRSLDGRQQKDIPLADKQFPRGVAFDPRGKRLAVSVGALLDSPFYMEADDRLLVYDLQEKAPVPTVALNHSYHADCLAFHPDGKQLAVAGGENQELTLWDLSHPKEPAGVQRGAGSGLWGVALSSDGLSVGVKDRRDPKSTNVNERGTGPWRVFDLDDRRMKGPVGFKPREQLQKEEAGWRVVPDPANPYLWYAVHRSGVRHPLPLDADQDGLPRCYAFLKPKEGQPVRLLVGHYWGLSLIELTSERARRTRLYTGHHGEVMAVAVAADGEWAVSASSDQTVAAWSLEAFPTGSELGVRFAVRGNKLVVEEVDAGSPGWESGLVKGDAVTAYSIYPAPVQGGPRDWLAQLALPEPGKPHFFEVERDGKPLKILSTLRRRPLWRLFPAKRGERDEWVLWMWRHCFYDTSTNGDSFVGWSVNGPDLRGAPTFYKAEQFRKLFKRPFEVNSLLKTHSTAKALRGDELLQPLAIDEKLPPAAEVVSVAPAADGAGFVARLRATPRGGDNPDYQPGPADMWVNDYRLAKWASVAREWKKDGDSFVTWVTVPAESLRRGRNALTLQVYNRLGGRSDASALVTSDRPAGRPRLFGLMVGINDYKDSRPSPGGKGEKLGNLTKAREDAEAMKRAWEEQKALYESPAVEFLPDPKANRANILAALDRVAEKAGPDDRFVLLLSGHGDYPKLGQAGQGHEAFVFCCPSYDPSRPLEAGVSSLELYEKLAAIKCRKVVLLDACHSGAIGDDNQVRSLTPGGRGPTILAACDRGQLSYEHDKLGHGLFTYALLRAMGEEFSRADLDGDGSLDANEIYRFTYQRVQELLKEIGAREGAQVPILFPDAPEVYQLVGKAPAGTKGK
jgi:WD40 repeat protein